MSNRVTSILGNVFFTLGKCVFTIKRKRFRVLLLSIISAVFAAVCFSFTGYGAAASSDREFENHLSEQGFPESYKNALRGLHAKYPNWVFYAQNTGLEWDDVVKNQSTLGKNLVASSSISSWKSIQPGAYNWDNSTWVGFDGASWVAASEEIIKYYLDPRNFLDEDGVFQFLTHGYNSSMQNPAGLASMTNGTFLANSFQEGNSTLSYGDIIMQAAAESGVNPYVLAAMIIQEQGSAGTSHSISGTLSGYEGYYNFFNIEAYASGNLTAVQRGLWYASQSGSYSRPWNSRQVSIKGGAEYYGTNYVKAGQDTFYLKKYNVQGSNLYLHQYMSNVQGAASEAKKLSQAYSSELKAMNLEFKIPVFNNMPISAVPIPTGTGSPNNLLSSLSISGYTLTPTFNKDITEYDVIVGNGVTSVTINASAIDSKATISGSGTINLSSSATSVVVTVKAENGTSKDYRINIARTSTITPGPGSSSGGSSSGPGQPNLSMSYTINDKGYVTGLTPDTSKADSLSKVTVSSGKADILKADGSEVTGSVGTGNVLKVYSSSGTVTAEHSILIKGDLNGDGVISALDLLRLQKHLLGVATLEGIFAEAADVDGNGSIGALDLLKLQKHILGIEKLTY